MLIRRITVFALAAFAALACTSTALAVAHPAHVRHVRGRVVAINPARHTLRLRVLHASKAAPKKAHVAGSPTYGSLHDWHSRRASRCAMTPTVDEDTRNGSMPMSANRVNATAALFVCSVVRTR